MESTKQARLKFWWNTHSACDKRLFTILTIFVVVFAVIIIRDFIQYAVEPVICLTPECLSAASKTTLYMDLKQDPCKDFYRFTCGNYLKLAEQENISAEVHLLDYKARKQYEAIFKEPPQVDDAKPLANLKFLYGTCMDEKNIEANGLRYAKEILENLGGWPVLKSNRWDEKRFDWKQLTYKMRRNGYYFETFFAFNLYQNLTEARNYLRISPPNPDGSEEKKLALAYIGFMSSNAVHFGADKHWATFDMKHVYDFRVELQKLLIKHEQSFDNKNLTFVTLADIQKESDQIDWIEFISEITYPLQLNVDDKIVFNVTGYVSDLLKLFAKTSPRVLANYMIWDGLEYFIPFMPKEFRDTKASFGRVHNKVMNITKVVKSDRSLECISEVKKIFRYVADQIYAERYAPQELRRKAYEIVVNVKKEFRNSLLKNDWMDEATKEFAVKKLEAMKEFIGGGFYPGDQKLVLPYSHMDLQDESNYLFMICRIRHHVNNFYFMTFNMSVEASSAVALQSFVSKVNGYYSSNNFMVIPAAFLQNTIFNDDFPVHLNYAILGNLVAHEITHAFTEIANGYGLYGEEINWWTNTTHDNYLETADCLVKQYENYTRHRINMTLNGLQVLNENAADTAGAAVAYRAFMGTSRRNIRLPGLQRFTAEQMFWIFSARFYCDPQEHGARLLRASKEERHGISSFRVVSPFGNSGYFADDFDCPLGSVMNPIDKCTIL